MSVPLRLPAVRTLALPGRRRRPSRPPVPRQPAPMPPEHLMLMLR